MAIVSKLKIVKPGRYLINAVHGRVKMTVAELIEALQECDPDEQCYVRINGNFLEIDDVYGVADANYYVIDAYEE